MFSRQPGLKKLDIFMNCSKCGFHKYINLHNVPRSATKASETDLHVTDLDNLGLESPYHPNPEYFKEGNCLEAGKRILGRLELVRGAFKFFSLFLQFGQLALGTGEYCNVSCKGIISLAG